MQPPLVTTSLSSCKCNDTATKACDRTRGELDTLLKDARVEGVTRRDTDAYRDYFKSLTCPDGDAPMDHCRKCSKTIDMHKSSAPPAGSFETMEVMKDVKQLKAYMLPIAKNALVPRATSRSTEVPPRVKKKMLDFYSSSNCIIMRALLLKGCDKWEMFRGEECPCYPAVHAHIIPQANTSTLDFLGIDVNDVRNALPLFKHIELEWDRGNIALIPLAGAREDSDALNVQVLVSRRLRHLPICFAKDGNVDDKQPVRDVSFGYLHGKTVTFFGDHKPYVRCLFLRWGTSYKEHPNEFTAPDKDILVLCNRDEEHKEHIASLACDGTVETDVESDVPMGAEETEDQPASTNARACAKPKKAHK